MEKKKFKINIIDIIILVLIVCVAVFVVMKFSDGGPVQEATSPDKVRIVYYHGAAADYVIDSTHVGDTVYDGSSEQNVGTVVAIETGDPNDYEYESAGGGAMEGYHSVKITTETYGTMTDHGVVINGTIYAPGHTLVIYAGQGKYYLTVYSVELVEP